jgi:hypothetical protein
MRIIRMSWSTMAAAEEALATVWCILEQHRIPTPQLTIRRAAGVLDLSIEFPSQADAELVRRAAHRLGADSLPIAAGSKPR